MTGLAVHSSCFGSIDWGTAPAWAAVAVAVVVGSFTVQGIRIARKTFVANAWQVKVRAARLVYAEVVDITNFGKGEPYSGSDGSSFDFELGLDVFVSGAEAPRRVQPSGTLFQSVVVDAAEPANNVQSSGIVLQDIVRFHVTIRNDSDEPVGDMHLRIFGPDLSGLMVGGETDPGRSTVIAFTTVGALPPGVTKDWLVLVRRTWPEYVSRYCTVRLDFTDSAAERWSRVGIDPPVPSEYEPPPRG